MISARRRFIVIVTVAYLVLALAWILLSDQLLSALPDLDSVLWLSEAKGVFFVLVSAVGFYVALCAMPTADTLDREQLVHMLVGKATPGWRSAKLTYPAAIALSVVMLALRHYLKIEFDDRPLLIMFMLPIILSAVLGGGGPGLVSTIVCTLGVLYFVLPPIYSFRVAAKYDLLHLGFLVLNGVVVSVLSEIVARSRTRAEVNRRLLDIVISGTPDAVFVKDRQGRYLMVNAASANIIGKALSEIIGRDDLALFGENTGKTIMAGDQAVMSAKQIQVYEQPIKATDGKITVFLVTKGPIFDEAGQVLGVFGISRDITERKRDEATLRASEAVLKTAQHLAGLGSWEWDVRSNKHKWSDEIYLIYGRDPALPPAEYPEVQNYFTPESWKCLAAAVEKSLSEGMPYECDAEVIRPDGDRRYITARGEATRDEAGNILSLHGTVQDITARKRIEEELGRHREHLEEVVAERTRQLEAANASVVEQEQFIRTVADAIPGMIAYWDSDLRCRFANAAYVTWFGSQPEEILGMRMQDLLGEELFLKIKPDMDAVLGGEPRQLQRTFIKKDGSTHYILVNSIPHRVGEQVRGAYIFISNITEIKQAELQLTALNKELALRANEAEAANRAKSAFVANMSHEIRTPLNAIIGLTHLLRRAEHAPEQGARLNKIDNASRHLLSIINDILDMSKIEAGRLQLESTDFHLSAVLDNVQSIIGDQARAKGIVVEIDPDSVPVWLRGDPTRLRQALLNYASNAIKFTDRGSIALRAILLEEHDNELLVRFEVQDTGSGIAADTLPGLFQSFEQADTSTTRKYGGTGLGLTITRRLANMMGGEADAISIPGLGSTFWFTARLSRGRGVMPNILVAADDTGAEDKLRKWHGDVRLLLAEDNPINREIALELLSTVGMAADCAENGNEAISMARANHYDLILMDLQMPHMDGLDAARAIRALPGREATPILAMTANAFDDDRRACKSAGMDDFVAKPVDPPAFFATLLKWLLVDKPTGATDPVVPRPALPTSMPAYAANASIPVLPGIDTQLGLGYARGRPAFYLNVLTRFRDEHAMSFAADFALAHAAGDWQTASRLAHTLKGLARVVGAVALGDALARLEQATTARETALIAGFEQEVGAELHRVLAGLAHLGESVEISTDAAAPAAWRELGERLATLLMKRDTAAVTCMDEFRRAMLSIPGREISPQTTLGLGDELAAMSRAVARYDYAEALELLLELTDRPNAGKGGAP